MLELDQHHPARQLLWFAQLCRVEDIDDYAKATAVQLWRYRMVGRVENMVVIS